LGQVGAPFSMKARAKNSGERRGFAADYSQLELKP